MPGSNAQSCTTVHNFDAKIRSEAKQMGVSAMRKRRYGHVERSERNTTPAPDHGERSSPLRLSPVLLELVVQRLQADAQNLGGAGLVVAGVFQGPDDEALLGVLHRSADAEAHGFGVVRHGGR